MRYLEEVVLEKDELEALKLHDVDELDQTAAAEKMGISQPTFARTLNKVYKKIFLKNLPARSCFEVKLAIDATIEVEAIAYSPK